jgi:hypothetical protein
MEFHSVRLDIPQGANLILGQAHFIKTAEDIYEVMVNTVPGAKFAVAFCEASGPSLIRVEANDDELRRSAISNAEAIGAGHVFVLLIREAYPINILGRVRDCFEVCSIFCATANPVEAIVAESGHGRGVLGVIVAIRRRASKPRSTRSSATSSSARLATSSSGSTGTDGGVSSTSCY